MTFTRYVRAVSRRVPDLLRRVLVRVHRPLIGNRVVPIDHRDFKIVVNPKDYCGGRLYYWDAYEPEQTAAFVELIREYRPGTFVDVGANIGYYTLLASSLGVQNILAFEPSASLAAAIEASVRLNRWEGRVSTQRVAVSDTNGTVTFYTNLAEHNFGLGSIVRHNPVSATQAVTVPARTLDSYLERLGAGPIVIKIDVEGAELQVLSGMQAVMENARPVLIMEVHPSELQSSGSSASELVKRVREHAYDVARLRHTALRPLTSGEELPHSPFWLVARPKRIR